MEKKLKVLNLYAGIGGNRKLWTNVEVTAVEYKKSIADAYKHFFPNDKVIVADAEKYLLENIHKDWDFIWASPPCPTHSKLGFIGMKNRIEHLKGNRTKEHSKDLEYPDMSLYQIILFLKHFANCKWVVENTFGYYEPLIKPQICGRHLFWANFHITNKKDSECNAVSVNSIIDKQKKLGFDISQFSFDDMEGHKKDKVLNNCVNPKSGKHIFDCAFRTKQKLLSEVSGNSSHN